MRGAQCVSTDARLLYNDLDMGIVSMRQLVMRQDAVNARKSPVVGSVTDLDSGFQASEGCKLIKLSQNSIKMTATSNDQEVFELIGFLGDSSRKDVSRLI